MAFDPAALGAIPVTPTQPQASSDFNPDELGAIPVSPKPVAPPQAPAAPAITNPLGKALVSVGDAAKDTTDALTGNSGNRVLDAVNPIGWASKLFGGVTDLAAKGVDALASVTTKPIASAIGSAARRFIGPEKVDTAVNAVANSPVGVAASTVANDKDVQAGLGAFGNIANAAGTVVGIAEGTKLFGKLPEAASAVGDAAKTTKTYAKLQDKYVKSAIAEWEKPTTVPNATYSKATEIADKAAGKGNNIPETLIKNNIRAADHVEGGKYMTAETAEKLRTDAGKMSHELLRPALEQADTATPRTPVQDIVSKTISDIKASTGVTPGDMQAQIAKAQAEGEALAGQYPNGMSLTDMHDNKITYASNGKYSPVGDTNVNNIAGVNRAFGRTLGNFVETKAPEGVPVKQFNAELQKQFQAADYLDSLNTKKVPQSIMSRIAKTTAKVVGAAVGDRLGGGILGGVGGYHIGGMLESTLEGLPNPLKSYFLDNLKRTNPEAFQAVQQYMGNEAAAQATRLALPAPIAPGEPGARAITPRAPLPPDEGRAPIVNYQSVPQLQLPAATDATANPISARPIPLRSKTLPPQNPLNPTRFPPRR